MAEPTTAVTPPAATPPAATNRVLVVRTPGGPQVLEVQHHPMPAPGPGQVRVQVEAVGVSHSDVLVRRGQPPIPFKPIPQPLVPGSEFCGIVDALGPGVVGVEPGMRVAALLDHAGAAQAYVVLDAWRCVPVPPGVDPADAASAVLNGLTAFRMLHRVAGVRPHDMVLVHAAAGGVGSWLLQLAREAGCRVIGTASRAKIDAVRALGAAPIDYTREDFVDRTLMLTGDGVDAVFDGVGGAHFIESYHTLKLGGTLVAYGMTSVLQKDGSMDMRVVVSGLGQLALRTFYPDGRRWAFFGLVMRRHDPHYQADVTGLFNMLAAGRVQGLVTERIPLEEAARAHDLMERGAIIGKVVLIP